MINKNGQSGTDPLISVIIPIYKVEKYLNRCINSILEQDYKNLQIILINDGSPDKCPIICDAYAKKDNRINVIHKSNGGLSDARNAGIKSAKGEYIVFVDSDDYVDKSYISQLYYLLQKYKADISICGYTEVLENSSRIHSYSKNYNEKIINKSDAMKEAILSNKGFFIVAWNKLYKRSIFLNNMILFPKGKINEDNFINYKLYFYAKKIVYTDQPLYHYVKRSDSIMGKIKFMPLSICIELTQEMRYFIRQNNLNLLREVDALFIINNLHYIGLMANSDKFNKAYWNKLRSNTTVLDYFI